MRNGIIPFLFGLSAIWVVSAQTAFAQSFPFTTSGDFVRICDSALPPEECLNAIMHVEQVVNTYDQPNETCDGGTDELLKSRSNEELNEKLQERVVRVVPWLKQHPEYTSQSYGDGIWSALKGVYCH